MMFSMNIHGSCISRDILQKIENKINVKEYISKQNIYSMLCEEKIDILKFKNVSDPHKLRYAERMVFYDSQKKSLDSICNNRSDYLLIDLIDERWKIAKYGNACISYSSFVTKSDYEELCKPDKFINTNYFDYNQTVQMLKKYVDIVKSAYDENRVIINKGYPVYTYINKQGEQCLFDKKQLGFCDVFIPHLEMMYSILENLLPNANVLNFPYDTKASENNKWGLAPFHYEEKWYLNQAEKILKIINDIENE